VSPSVGREELVSRLRYSGSISLDGFAAGPDQSRENPLGVGGRALHTWVKEREDTTSRLLEDEELGVGALLMGRNMFGGGPGPWGEEPWPGWWGPNPPFHLPVFVLTHHPRAPLECDGGTTFTFVTKGLDDALAQARQAANGQHVDICGGATVAKQYLAAGLLDEMLLHLVPVFLGVGVRLFDDETLDKVTLEQAFVVEAPGVTHLKYRVVG
jgi:dihydrofolate reductase